MPRPLMPPAVSILIPVRNEERHLPAALRSLASQTFTGWELVVVDDGSTDATPSILREASRRDGRVRVVTIPPTGIVGALNAGLSACRAPLIARMDGDDVSHPRRIEAQVRFLEEQPDIGLVACGTRHFPRNILQGGMLHYERWQNSLLAHDDIVRDLYVESPFAHPSVMFRREVVTTAGGYREAGWAEDYDLWLRLAARGVRFSRLSEILFFWRDRPERLTRSAPSCTADAFRACKAHHLMGGYLKGESVVTLWGAGMEGKAWRKVLLKEGVAVARWVDIDPRKVGQTIHGAPVVLPEGLKSRGGKTLVTVGAKGARALVRDWADANGLAEGVDYVVVT